MDMTDIVRTLGRVQHYDARNENYRIRDIVAQPAHPKSKYYYDNGWWGNQGNVGACTAFASTHYRDAGPVRPSGKGKAPIDPLEMYAKIQEQDRLDGRNFSEGATSLAMAKAMKNLGWITEYRWGYTIDELITAVSTKDCVVVGTNWYENMFTPINNKSGRAVVSIGGQVAGGHEYLITGIDMKAELLRIKNSWGRSWGNSGRAWISFSDMQQLIEKEEGDMCLATETLIKTK
jgi:hypothetical protein